MKFSIQSMALKPALTKLGTVISNNGNDIPILKCVHIEVMDGKVEFRACDQDQFVSIAVEAETQEQGFALLPFKQFKSACETAYEDRANLTIECVGGKANLKMDGDLPFSWSFKTQDVDDYPSFPSVETGRVCLSVPDVQKLFGNVAFAMSKEETRYYLNGAYLHIDNNDFVAVATDGHRLALQRLPFPMEADKSAFTTNGQNTSGIIPRRAVDFIIRNLPKNGSNEPAMLSWNQHYMKFEGPNFALFTKLVDSTFPDYTRVIPKADLSTSVEINRAVFLRSASALYKFGEKKECTDIRFNPTSVDLKKSCVHQGEIGCRIPSIKKGLDLELGCNSGYLKDLLGALEGDMINLSIDDCASPARFTNTENDDHICVLMPMRSGAVWS